MFSPEFDSSLCRRERLTLSLLDDRINLPPVSSLHQISGNSRSSRPQGHKRRFSVTMEERERLVDPEKTPRPSKKRNIGLIEGEFIASSAASYEGYDAQSQSSAASSELESHKSGRMSPSKQMAQLEDLEHPIKVLDFGSAEASILKDVEKMRAEAQLLADGIGILGYNVRMTLWRAGFDEANVRQ